MSSPVPISQAITTTIVGATLISTTKIVKITTLATGTTAVATTV